MAKRILAWILLVGFILLLLNIIVFQVFLMQSVAVYAVIAIWFVFSNKPLPSNKIIKTSGNGQENTEEDKNDEGVVDFDVNNEGDVDHKENK